jgi:lipoprotein-anchoring transpeptidase ErfK/SrfK
MHKHGKQRGALTWVELLLASLSVGFGLATLAVLATGYIVQAAPPETELPTATPPIQQATPVLDEGTSPPTTLVSDTLPSPTPPESTLATYTVRPGDTLAKIAAAHGVSLADLIAVNAITNPNVLYTGQTITLPEGARVPDQTDPVIPPSPQPTQAPDPVDPPAEEPTPPAEEPDDPAPQDGRWIDVDLSEQALTAYEGSIPVRSTLVSTGLPNTPTPVGQFSIWIKLRYDDMAGPGYYIEDVPYVMYFHQGYGLHGVTWHGNFGHPMSHGCVNLPTAEAAWLFDWAEVGTVVVIHA